MGSVTSKGQTIISKEIRDMLGLIYGDKVIFLADGDQVIMRKVDEEKLSTILSRQKPWRLSGVEYQRRIRGSELSTDKARGEVGCWKRLSS